MKTLFNDRSHFSSSFLLLIIHRSNNEDQTISLSDFLKRFQSKLTIRTNPQGKQFHWGMSRFVSIFSFSWSAAVRPTLCSINRWLCFSLINQNKTRSRCYPFDLFFAICFKGRIFKIEFERRLEEKLVTNSLSKHRYKVSPPLFFFSLPVNVIRPVVNTLRTALLFNLTVAPGWISGS